MGRRRDGHGHTAARGVARRQRTTFTESIPRTSLPSNVEPSSTAVVSDFVELRGPRSPSGPAGPCGRPCPRPSRSPPSGPSSSSAPTPRQGHGGGIDLGRVERGRAEDRGLHVPIRAEVDLVGELPRLDVDRDGQGGLATTNGDSEVDSPQMMSFTASSDVVMSTHLPPSKWRSFRSNSFAYFTPV